MIHYSITRTIGVLHGTGFIIQGLEYINMCIFETPDISS